MSDKKDILKISKEKKYLHNLPCPVFRLCKKIPLHSKKRTQFAEKMEHLQLKILADHEKKKFEICLGVCRQKRAQIRPRKHRQLVGKNYHYGIRRIFNLNTSLLKDKKHYSL